MQTIRYQQLDCVPLENETLKLLVTQSAGPRIISLRFQDGENLFAELPDLVTERPDGQVFRLYGGHRLWHAPEAMPRTYIPDDAPVDIRPSGKGILATQSVEAETGIEKSMQIILVEDKPQVLIQHTLTNRGLWAVECAPWAITQVRANGVAILPQGQAETGMLPNRSLALWQYTDLTAPQVIWGNRYLLVHAAMRKPFKVGFPNPRGWLAYWLDDTLFVKRAGFDLYRNYYDFGSSSECYCNDLFLELETLAPITKLEPEQSVTHLETWEVYGDVERPDSKETAQRIVERLGLE